MRRVSIIFRRIYSKYIIKKYTAPVEEAKNIKLIIYYNKLKTANLISHNNNSLAKSKLYRTNIIYIFSEKNKFINNYGGPLAYQNSWWIISWLILHVKIKLTNFPSLISWSEVQYPLFLPKHIHLLQHPATWSLFIFYGDPFDGWCCQY